MVESWRGEGKVDCFGVDRTGSKAGIGCSIFSFEEHSPRNRVGLVLSWVRWPGARALTVSPLSTCRDPDWSSLKQEILIPDVMRIVLMILEDITEWGQPRFLCPLNYMRPGSNGLLSPRISICIYLVALTLCHKPSSTLVLLYSICTQPLPRLNEN